MSVKVISYDLGGPETSYSYSRLIDAIKSLGASNNIKPLESFWLVDSYRSCSDIRDTLTPYLDSNDKLFVAELKPYSCAGYNLDQNNTSWISAHNI